MAIAGPASAPDRCLDDESDRKHDWQTAVAGVVTGEGSLARDQLGAHESTDTRRHLLAVIITSGDAGRESEMWNPAVGVRHGLGKERAG